MTSSEGVGENGRKNPRYTRPFGHIVPLNPRSISHPPVGLPFSFACTPARLPPSPLPATKRKSDGENARRRPLLSAPKLGRNRAGLSLLRTSTVGGQQTSQARPEATLEGGSRTASDGGRAGRRGLIPKRVRGRLKNGAESKRWERWRKRFARLIRPKIC
jgi:hypothetical protein